MSSPLTVKRRRLNDATSTLTKPFVSPMRAGGAKPVDRKPLRESSSVANVPYTPSTLAHTVKPLYHDSDVSIPPTKPAPVPATATSARRPPAFTSTSKRKDPAELAAQKSLVRLEMKIRALRNDLDTLDQSHQITNSTTDDELSALADKWRLASQSAAEELFGTVKERVCRMGGVAAWRESEKRKHERANGFGEFAQEAVQEDDDADCEFDSQGEELPEDEVEWRKKEKRRVREEAENAADLPDAQEEVMMAGGGGKPKVWQEEGKEDDTFTIDMMLRSLNIELNVIGYDKQAQRWA